MTRILSFSFFVIIALSMHAQNNDDISGVWVRYDQKMKDGSKILFAPDPQKQFFSIRFNEKEMFLNPDPVSKAKLPISYTRKGKHIITSPTSGYTIEKISKDTLVLCERIDGFTPDKLKCLYLVNINTLFQKELEQNKNKEGIVAKPFFSPKLKTDIPILKAIGHGNVKNENLIGNLIINVGSSTISVEVLETTMNRRRLKATIEVIEASYEKWNLEDFRQFKKITIPFSLETNLIDSNHYRSISMSLHFFTHELRKRNPALPSFEDVALSDNYYSRALKAYDASDYDKAVTLFSKAYENNPRNLDSRYNQAITLYEGGKPDEACEIWQELKNLEQVPAADYYKNFCEE